MEYIVYISLCLCLYDYDMFLQKQEIPTSLPKQGSLTIFLYTSQAEFSRCCGDFQSLSPTDNKLLIIISSANSSVPADSLLPFACSNNSRPPGSGYQRRILGPHSIPSSCGWLHSFSHLLFARGRRSQACSTGENCVECIIIDEDFGLRTSMP